MTPDDANRRLGRGINFGNALDAVGADAAAFTLREHHFDVVRDAGFDTVRLPVRWSAHAGASPPYRIDPAFGERVDRAVELALARGLNVVLNVHHYHELQASPNAHRARFLALWTQIAARYADRSGRLCFELLNEPRDAMTAGAWNALLGMALAAVRATNPERFVIIGPARMNDIDALPELTLPADGRLIATVHYYAPFEFTHQGASWTVGAERWLGTGWGDEADRHAVRDDLTRAAAWARAQGRPLFIGEFGAYERADMTSRVRWTRFVRTQAERLGLSWCYWEFGTDFGAYDPRHDTWREGLRDALLGEDDPAV